MTDFVSSVPICLLTETVPFHALTLGFSANRNTIILHFADLLTGVLSHDLKCAILLRMQFKQAVYRTR